MEYATEPMAQYVDVAQAKTNPFVMVRIAVLALKAKQNKGQGVARIMLLAILCTYVHVGNEKALFSLLK